MGRFLAGLAIGVIAVLLATGKWHVPSPGAPASSGGSSTVTAPDPSGGGGGQAAGNASCNYQEDTWSGDAGGVGYSASKVSSSDGNPASFAVQINANSGTTEVVGYPSDQCLMYSAIPAHLTSSYRITPPSGSGLDYEYAYDIWLTGASQAKASNWDNDLELMVWTYTNGQTPAGSVKGTLGDGSKVWTDGDNSTGIVSVVFPQNHTSGTVDLAALIGQLKSRGYVSGSLDGILDVEYGIEAPYGGGKTFTVNSLSVSA